MFSSLTVKTGATGQVVGEAFINQSLTFGFRYDMNYGCNSSDVNVTVIPSDGVNVKISGDTYLFTAKRGLNSGSVKLIYKFVDGTTFERTFNISK